MRQQAADLAGKIASTLLHGLFHRPEESGPYWKIYNTLYIGPAILWSPFIRGLTLVALETTSLPNLAGPNVESVVYFPIWP